MDRFLMSILANILSVDHTFKSVRKLAEVNGHPIFRALWTALNEFGQLRMATLTYSTAQEDLKPSLEAFKATVEALGHHGLQLLYTDNTRSDTAFFKASVKFVADPAPQPAHIRHIREFELPAGVVVCTSAALLA